MASESHHQYRDTLTEEISFKELLLNLIKWGKYIASKWIVILSISILAGLIGLYNANRKPVLYIASSSFVLQEPGVATNVVTSDFASIMGFNTPEAGGMFLGDNLLHLYKTRFMIKKTLLSNIPGSKEYLVDRYIKINNLRTVWTINPRLKNIDFHKRPNKKYVRIQDSLVNSFVNDINFNYLNVERVDRLNIIRVDVRSKDEEFSKLLNDQIVQTVNDFYIQTKTRRSMENLKLLQHQTDSIRAALNGAMYRVAASADVTVNPNPARQVLRLPAQRSQVESETSRAMLNELVRDLEVSKMSLRKETPLIEVMDEPVFPLEKFRESRAKATLIWTVAAALLTVAFFTVKLLVKKVLE